MAILKVFPRSLVLGLTVVAALGTVVYWGGQIRVVEGTILGDQGPLAGATVRIKGTPWSTTTDAQGRFSLSGFPSRFKLRLTAWKEGYYIGGETVYPWTQQVQIKLDSYVQHDNWGYAWASSHFDPYREESCARCKSAPKQGDPIPFPANIAHAVLWRGTCERCHPASLPYDQWKESAHAQSFKNPRFRSVYFGTDLLGEERGIPPGFRLDFPTRAGNCAACHAPTAALWPGGARMETVTQVDEQGVHCDFCHKIADVIIDPATGLPPEGKPGVFAFKLMRPSPERQLFFGPYDDVDAGTDTYSHWQEKSEICAPCHQASFNGTPIYESFAEWLASPYPQEGKTCQACHMKPDGITTTFVYPGKGGITRDPDTIFTHRFPGVDPELLKNTVELELSAQREGGILSVEVMVTNVGAGHHVPTDHPMRHMLLVVEAQDSHGLPLTLLEGQTIPDWGADYAGRPGKGFAKILEEVATGKSPTIAYWKPVRIQSDTRIPALETDRSRYVFEAPQEGEITVTVTLIFRRAFKELAEQKKWSLQDFLIKETRIVIP